MSIDRSIFRRLKPRRRQDEAWSPQPSPSPARAPRGGGAGSGRRAAELQEPQGPGSDYGAEEGEDWEGPGPRVPDEVTKRLQVEQAVDQVLEAHARALEAERRRIAAISAALSHSGSAPMVGSRPRAAPAQYGAGFAAPPSPSTPQRRGQASMSQTMGSTWQSTPPRPRAPKTDRVTRGAQVRNLWSHDRFLRTTNDRKFDLRGCGSPAAFKVPARRPSSASRLLIPTYVPPHEKRRDDVRTQVREQMRAPAFL